MAVAKSFMHFFTPPKSLPLGLQNHTKTICIFGMVCLLLLLWKDIIRDSLSTVKIDNLYRKSKSVDPIANSTLGFQEIFALVLPGRDDRKAPLLKAAEATNITLTVLDAVKDDQIPKEQRPKGWGEKGHEPRVGEIGCLRSHVMTWEKIIAENISSALIMESDADWDMRIHDILPPVAEGAKTIVDWPFTPLGHPRDLSTQEMPYGDNWDIIWIGHCGSKPGGSGRVYAINDTTVPPQDHEYSFVGSPWPLQHPKGTRIVFQFQITICTTAYAISNQGAHKMRKFLEDSNLTIDVRMQSLCNDQPSLVCLGVWPQVISAAPSVSNIKHQAGEKAPGSIDEPSKELTVGPALQYSARRNAEVALKGLGLDKWKKEF